MASPSQPVPQGAPQGGAPAGASAPPATGQVLQLVAIITQASNKLAEVFPAASPMKDAIQDQLKQVQQKVNETQSPSQPQAPPI